MNVRANLVVVVIALHGCAINRSVDVPCEVVAQALKVESLVARHGYTCAEHPKGLPVEGIHMFDGVFSEEELLKVRRCTFSPRAHSYMFEDGAAVFNFKDENRVCRECGHLAGLNEDGNLWANESYSSINNPDFTRMPSNNALKRRRAECARS